MIKKFPILRKIELTEEQNKNINSMVEIALTADKNKDMLAVIISMEDITSNKLNDNFCPIIWMKNDNFEFYSTLKLSSPIVPEIQTLSEMLPRNYITIWRAE